MNTQNAALHPYERVSVLSTSCRDTATKKDRGLVRRTDGRSRTKSLSLKGGLFRISFVIFIVMFFCVAGILNITAEGSEKMVGKQYKSIQIEEGDTLWSIALDYNDESLSDCSIEEYIDDIMKINNLVRDDKITSGNYIIVPIYVIQN